MKAFKYLICLAAAVGISGTALAGSFTFVTPGGSTDTAGEAVNAQAIFTPGNGTLSITLDNLIVNQKSVGQDLSDLFFTLSNVTAGGSLTSSSGLERTVVFGGTFTDGSTVSTGWGFTVTGGVFHLNALVGGTAPTHTIIGAPDGSNLYSNANDSITGSAMHTPGVHSPFLVGDVTFTLAIAGINSDTIVTGATFSFGTTAGDNVPGTPPTVPDSGTTSMLLGGALACLGVMRRYLKR